MEVHLLIALLAGLISFLSPCVLPLIPGYISYISGTSLDKIKGKKGNLIVFKTIFLLWVERGIGSLILGGCVVGTYLRRET